MYLLRYYQFKPINLTIIKKTESVLLKFRIIPMIIQFSNL